jgi:hypothetical protein
MFGEHPQKTLAQKAHTTLGDILHKSKQTIKPEPAGTA